ncbi:hypothetical protein CB1_000803015 [Camelus ferus]|nr:hypothetical protein CB1_000803015 [Camelus ferus]
MILNLPELIDDSMYRTNHLRVQNRKELIKILSTRLGHPWAFDLTSTDVSAVQHPGTLPSDQLLLAVFTWTIHSSFGKQLTASSARLDLPSILFNMFSPVSHRSLIRLKLESSEYEGVVHSTHRFEEETTSEWLYLFEGSGVPYGPINNMKNVFAEPQLSVRAEPAQLLIQLQIDLGDVQGLEHGAGSETLMK